jgi:hypothetical protein
MKKLLLLCSILMYCLSANSQSFTASPGTVASGSDVTFTGNGESAVAYFGVVYRYSLSPTSTPVTAALNGSVTTYSLSTLSPTKLKLTFTNNTSTAQSVTVWFACAVNNSVTGSQNTSYQTAVTVTVNPAVTNPTVFYSAAYSKPFTRNNCGAGYQGGSYTYGVPYGFRTAGTQAAANQLAIDYVNANGQAAANVSGTCSIIYYSTAISGNFTKNNCDPHYESVTPVSYTLQAGAKTSTVSQADANALALPVFNTNGQNNANANGTCVPKNLTVITYFNSSYFHNAHVSRVRVYTAGTSTLIGDFTEAQITAGAEIPFGTYDFVITTSGTSSAWGSLDFGYYTSSIIRQYNTGATNYTYSNYNTTGMNTVAVVIYFGDPQ